jgi:hypothetical protein
VVKVFHFFLPAVALLQVSGGILFPQSDHQTEAFLNMLSGIPLDVRPVL